MITAITENNVQKYNALFDKATKALKAEALIEDSILGDNRLNYTEDVFVGIDTLEKYFNCIGDLKKLDTKYTILPLSEDYFEIDANTRLIDVPKNSFKKNGIGVVGDREAEILYFRIDRYFDYMDLASDNIQIYIQWEGPDKTQQTSTAWIKDYDTHTDKLVFGWPLSKEIMKQAGKLKFSVRFVMMEQGVVTYSLSTITAEVMINDGLNFNDDKLEANSDVNNSIFNRITNSKTNSNDDIDVPAPRFAASAFNPEPANQEIDLVNNELVVTAKAYKTDTHGNLTYGLVGSAIGETITDLESYEIDGAIERQVKVGDKYHINTEYYTKTDDGIISVQVPTLDQDYVLENGIYRFILPLNAPEGTTDTKFYEKIGQATIKKAGTYYFAAINNYNTKQSMRVADKGYKVPGPVNATIVCNKAGFVGKTENTFAASDFTIATSAKDTVSYGLVKYNTSLEEYEPIVTNQDSLTDINATNEGIYQLLVTTTRNNYSKSVYSSDFNIYAPATLPEGLSLTANDGLRVGATVQVSIPQDSSYVGNLTYQWLKKNSSGTEQTIGTSTSSSSITLSSSEAGWYVGCKIISTYQPQGANNTTNTTIWFEDTVAQ